MPVKGQEDKANTENDVNNKISKRKVRVLGIESSCDDTGVAIINQDGQILSNCIHSQLKQHLTNGGIIPVVAKDYHLENIDRVAREAFAKSGLKSVSEDIDAIAVATRPGLQYSLEVGMNYAKTLAKKYSKPLIPIHHMQAHALMPLLEHRASIRFPFLALLISGGHCLIAIAKRFNEFHVLGESMDDAPGDLLDKYARRLKFKNLGPPFDRISGGAAIELLSQRAGADRFKYYTTLGSIPYLMAPNCDFSFSGFRDVLDDMAPKMDQLWLSKDRDHLMTELSHISASLQRGILVQLAKKLSRAVLFYKMFWRYENEDAFARDGEKNEHLGFKLRKLDDADDEHNPIDLLVSGGVAANRYIVQGLQLACTEGIQEKHMKVFSPSVGLCNDNGLMIAWNGLLRHSASLEGVKSVNECDSIDESVIQDVCQFKLVHVKTKSALGVDLTDRLRSLRLSTSSLKHAEFKTKVVNKNNEQV